jgi:hypothetical protein
VQDVVTTGDYAAEGPHFLDWKALAENGNVSMAAVPMHSCNKPVAVLCLASKQVSCRMCWLLPWDADQLSGISCGMHVRKGLGHFLLQLWWWRCAVDVYSAAGCSCKRRLCR